MFWGNYECAIVLCESSQTIYVFCMFTVKFRHIYSKKYSEKLALFMLHFIHIKYLCCEVTMMKIIGLKQYTS